MNQNKIGEIKYLFVSSKEENKRLSKQKILVDTKGIREDKFYNTNKERSILLTSLDAYKLMKQNDIFASHGQLGENILVNFNPYELENGTQLCIGETILEITIECTICNFLTKINNKVPKLLKNNRGVFARVIKGGSISINDSIEINN